MKPKRTFGSGASRLAKTPALRASSPCNVKPPTRNRKRLLVETGASGARSLQRPNNTGDQIVLEVRQCRLFTIYFIEIR